MVITKYHKGSQGTLQQKLINTLHDSLTTRGHKLSKLYRQSTQAGCDLVCKMVYTYACLLSVPYKEKLLPQPDLIHRVQICFSSLPLFLWILVKSQLTDCLPFTTRPCTFDLLIHPVFIFETIRFKRMKGIACLPLLYQLQQHSSIFYISAAISSEDQIIELVFFAFAYVCILFAFCLPLFTHQANDSRRTLMQPRLSIGLITMAQLCP